MIATANTATLSWFAAHEIRLAWRDWKMLMSGGRKLKDRAVLVGMALFVLGVHGIAWIALTPHLPIAAGTAPGKAMLAAISVSFVLTFTMMFSQALEQVTRAFYARDDLDLILSSPAPSRHLFAVRITAMAMTTALMSGLVVAPFVNVAAILDGAYWLAAYPVIIALAGVAAGAAVLTTLMLFRHVGAKRTRLIAQIAAAVVGASFLIGIQTAAILAYGSLSRFEFLKSEGALAQLPDAGSLLWVPAKAVMGMPAPFVLFSLASLAFFAAVVWRGSLAFRAHVVAAMGVSEKRHRHVTRHGAFRARSTFGALLHKEWLLLARDPWLISQTLMQILYLVPPALLLWVSYGAKTNVQTILAPVLVMAAGQLAGALAWLAISGEDAPDLVATAPVRPAALIWAKVVSVLALIGAVALPFVLAIAFLSLHGAAVILIGVLAGAACAILIQLWFRAQAKRTNFRRRQVASRISTILEALASILCAGTAAVAAAGSWLAVVPAGLCLIVMGIAWLVSPRGN